MKYLMLLQALVGGALIFFGDPGQVVLGGFLTLIAWAASCIR